MNRSVRDIGGSVLLVPQFTLAADTSGGLRPSFSRAAPPAVGAALFDAVVAAVAATGTPHATRAFRRRHASHFDERRPRHVLVAGRGRVPGLNRVAYH